MTQCPLLVIVPCLNEEKNIGRIVAGLLKESETLPIHIIIADGGSSDGTAEIAKRLAVEHDNITYLHNPKKLQSAAVNLAVEQFGENKEYLIRIDAHADYPMDYCHALLEEAKATKAASVVVSMQTKGGASFQRIVAAAQNSLLGNGGSAHRLSVKNAKYVDHGHHALMRIDAFRSVGGYDENFSHNEDAELDYRLIQQGHKIWLTAKTFVTYYPRSTPVDLFTQYKNYGRGRAQTIAKHRMLPKLRQLAPAAIMPMIVMALCAQATLLMLLPLLGWMGLCLGYGYWLGKKANSQEIMYTGAAVMIMHFGWSLGFWQGVIEALWKNKP